MTQKKNKESESIKRIETNDIKIISRMNQSKEFHDFDDESKNENMMKYSKDESMIMFKKNTTSKKKLIIKFKIMKKQVKQLMILKKLKISNSIRIMKNQKRFNI